MTLTQAKTKLVFLDALDKAHLAERAAFLDEACGQDPTLRLRVEALLQAHDRPDRLLDHSAAEHFGGERSDDVDAARTDPDLNDSLDFLAPSQNAGSLGRLGHYEVLEVAGRGGMGIVLRAFDQKLERVVAIKVLAPRLAARSAARQRFAREARAAAGVTDNNVITIYAVEDAGSVPFLVMPFLDGRSLQEKLDRTGVLPLDETLRIGWHIAKGLAAAHRHGLVHRDVKPANILLENGVERVQLTDFGLARAGDEASACTSASASPMRSNLNLVAGTPMYMSPEQAQGEPIDCRSDLFSLGSVLYTMCTGQPPFRGATTLAVLKQVCEESPRPVREINPELPPWLDELLTRLHAKAPADRIASAQEVADLLALRLLEFQRRTEFIPVPIEQKTIGPWSTSEQKNESRSTSEKRQEFRSTKTRRRSKMAAVFLALLVALLGMGMGEATGVTNLRGTVIPLLSPNGTLIVEVDDPAVSVQIDGSEIVIKGIGPQEIRLRPARYTVEASKGGR
jgi:serine/threonine protein kinase